MVRSNHFISMRTTLPCPAGSRAWKSSFGSAACGLKNVLIFLPSAWAFIALLAILTAAISTSFSFSLILFLKNPSFKSWSSRMAIYAIFTQSITVKSILLSSIGEQQNSSSIWQGTWQQLLRWRQKSSNASITSLSFTFSGKFSTFCFPIPIYL